MNSSNSSWSETHTTFFDIDQNLYESFETTDLLAAVDLLDEVRGVLGDGPGWEPPELRTNLLNLHQLAIEDWQRRCPDEIDAPFVPAIAVQVVEL